MNAKRLSGVLLHPSSLPETPGIGTLGKQALRFIDWLKAAGQGLWQVLPLGPTGYGDSPYASFSTFAGNPLLIDIDKLIEEGWLSAAEAAAPDYIKNSGYIDFGSLVWWKLPLLKRAAKNFLEKTSKSQSSANEQNSGPEQAAAKAYRAFKKRNEGWLESYSIFMSIKEFYDKKAQTENRFGAMWNNYWPKELAAYNADAVKAWKKENKQNIEIHSLIQFFFFEQWQAVKNYANKAGISIIGDIPIFVAPDSADVWANQNLFQLDKSGCPKVVAGVPPDYFSATGQLWGNPLYDWERIKEDSYAWWIERIRASLKLVDFVRIDHFRGFDAYWAVPAKEKTAVKGKWIRGPGANLFRAIEDKLGKLPLIAEDLGLITDRVRKLRDDFNFPGMRVLQFAFDLNEAGKGGLVNPFLPHMYSRNSVVYTGTHDNDTMQGWLDRAKPEEIGLIKNYLSGAVPDLELTEKQLCPALISAAFFSTANFAIIPIQDLFAISSEGRINIPSTIGGINWQWRMDAAHLDPKTAAWLADMAKLSGRNLPQ